MTDILTLADGLGYGSMENQMTEEVLNRLESVFERLNPTEADMAYDAEPAEPEYDAEPAEPEYDAEPAEAEPVETTQEFGQKMSMVVCVLKENADAFEKMYFDKVYPFEYTGDVFEMNIPNGVLRMNVTSLVVDYDVIRQCMWIAIHL